MDIIDHNPTAITATTSFHGTGTSHFIYRTQADESEKRGPFQIRDKHKMADLKSFGTLI